MLKNSLKVTLVAPLLFISSIVLASTYSFTGVNTNEINITNQLSLDVNQLSDSSVSFKFSNLTGGTQSFIGQIYFDFLSTDYIASLTQTDQSGSVLFKTNLNPDGSFPEGKSIGFTKYDAGATKDGGENGVDMGEYLILTALLNPNVNIDSLLQSGELRIGLHVQGFATGGSDSYVNTPNAVPLPAAAWLFGSALLGFVGFRRKGL